MTKRDACWYIAVTFIVAGLILILNSLNAITVFSMNTGYEVESLSEEETQKQRSFLKISVKNTPAKGESIVQFDVNDDGKIALLTKKFGTRKTHMLTVLIVTFFSMFIMQRNIKAKDPNNSLHWYGKVNTT